MHIECRPCATKVGEEKPVGVLTVCRYVYERQAAKQSGKDIKKLGLPFMKEWLQGKAHGVRTSFGALSAAVDLMQVLGTMFCLCVCPYVQPAHPCGPHAGEVVGAVASWLFTTAAETCQIVRCCAKRARKDPVHGAVQTSSGAG